MYVFVIPISLFFCFFFLYDPTSHPLAGFIFIALIIGSFALFVINKPVVSMLTAIFSMAFATMLSKEMGVSYYLTFFIIPIWSIYYILCNMPHKGLKSFCFLLSWLASYWVILFIFRPYPIPFGFITTTFIHLCLFAWACTVNWDSRRLIFFTSIYGLYLIVFGLVEKLYTNVERIGGPTTFATNYAILVAVLWTIIFVESCVSRRFLWPILVIISAFSLFVILLSGTRMGLIGMGIGFLIGIFSSVWVRNLEKPLKQKIMLLSIFGFTGILSIFVIWSFIPKELIIIQNFNKLLTGNVDSSSYGRILAWIAAWEAFSNNVLWGNGPFTFIEIHGAFLRSLPQNLTIHQGYLPIAHNVILNVLAENGLIAFLNLFVVGVFCVWQCLKFLIKNQRNSVGYSLLAGFIILFSLEMLDGTPSNGFDPLYYGIMASFGIRK